MQPEHKKAHDDIIKLLKALDPSNDKSVENVNRAIDDYKGNSLDLSSIASTLSDNKNETLVGISSAIASNSNLTSLTISGGYGFSEANSLALVNILKDSKTITELDLSDNWIGSKAFDKIITAIGKLTSLNLANNYLGDKDVNRVAELAAALKGNETLKCLNIESNDIGVDGAADLAAALYYGNSTLTSLNLASNNIRDHGAADLAAALNGNSTLTSLNLEGNNIPLLPTSLQSGPKTVEWLQQFNENSGRTNQNDLAEIIGKIFMYIPTDEQSSEKIQNIIYKTRDNLQQIPSDISQKDRTEQVGTILNEYINNIGKLARDEMTPKFLVTKARKAVNNYTDSLLQEQSGSGGTFDVLCEEILESQLDNREGHIRRTQERWQNIHDNLGIFSKLADLNSEDTRSLNMDFHSANYLSEAFPPHISTTYRNSSVIKVLDEWYDKKLIPQSMNKYFTSDDLESLSELLQGAKTENNQRAEFITAAVAILNKCRSFTDLYGGSIRFVSYLTENEREQYKLTIKDGLLYQGDKIFDTTKMYSKGENGKVIFIITEKGEIYSAEFCNYEFHHSSFMAGGRVLAAGMIGVKDGKITYLDDNSGHYSPGEHNVHQALMIMEQQGNSLESVFADGGKITIKYGDSQKAPEAYHDFMQRAAGPAQKEWDELVKKTEKYKATVGYPALPRILKQQAAEIVSTKIGNNNITHAPPSTKTKTGVVPVVAPNPSIDKTPIKRR
ncbi:MAG: hypothetical protein AAF195_00240 [Pseudomonadota bacterium]